MSVGKKHFQVIKGGYTTVPNSIWKQDLSAVEKLLLAYLISNAEDFHPTTRQMAEAVGVQRNTVMAALKRLEDKGYIIPLTTDRRRGDRMPNRYELVDPSNWPTADTSVLPEPQPASEEPKPVASPGSLPQPKREPQVKPLPSPKAEVSPETEAAYWDTYSVPQERELSYSRFTTADGREAWTCSDPRDMTIRLWTKGVNWNDSEVIGTASIHGLGRLENALDADDLRAAEIANRAARIDREVLAADLYAASQAFNVDGPMPETYRKPAEFDVNFELSPEERVAIEAQVALEIASFEAQAS